MVSKVRNARHPSVRWIAQEDREDLRRVWYHTGREFADEWRLVTSDILDGKGYSNTMMINPMPNPASSGSQALFSRQCAYQFILQPSSTSLFHHTLHSIHIHLQSLSTASSRSSDRFPKVQHSTAFTTAVETPWLLLLHRGLSNYVYSRTDNNDNRKRSRKKPPVANGSTRAEENIFLPHVLRPDQAWDWSRIFSSFSLCPPFAMSFETPNLPFPTIVINISQSRPSSDSLISICLSS
ncbi:hypothetical protein CROQUDRAFT_85525 [Cronartium quercuum f. sp. fusiforme G11]|uniref:Uncharacterized protein n=1 Tax=Cronartium quercuum f. sp. fusiforme G11 TaxID=708437 RepID=A0A9P6THF0_9BASI|nr:hypothetical protein CROQUDRAFT_85525 [Cronartium quercuum f. sp. fusiforme G11]